MDVISPVAACPHCGLPLDGAAAAAPVEAVPAEVAAMPPPVAALPEPVLAAEPARLDEEEPAWSDPWAAFAIDDPEYAPAEAASVPAPRMPALAPEPPAPEKHVVAFAPRAPEERVAAFAPVPAPEPPAPPVAELEPPVVAEFAPLYTHAEPEPEPPSEPPVPEPEPWITVPAETIAAAVASTPAARAPDALDRPAEGFVVDTGRGWGIRDVSGADGAPSPVATTAPHLAEVALAPAAEPHPAPAAGRTRSLRLAITGVAVLVLGAVTYAGVSGGALSRAFGGTSPVAAPAAIGSLTRVSGTETEALLASVQSKVRASSPTQAVAAVYGTGSTPKLVFVAYSGAAAQTPDQLVATVNASGTPFTQTPTISTVGGQSYVCGRVGATAAPSVICTWTDSRAAGFVYAIGSSDVGGALHLADVARVASESAR